MATKKYLELQEFKDADLLTELAETEKQYNKMQFDHAIQGLENPMVLREIRRDIARLKTEIRNRELAAMDEQQLAKRTKKVNKRRSSNK
jgi:large subunit ribosomal protein L29